MVFMSQWKSCLHSNTYTINSYNAMGMCSFYLLFIGICALLFIIVILLFGDLPNYRDTILNKLHHILVDNFFKFITNKLQQFDNTYLNSSLTSQKGKLRLKWLFGWTVPILYLIIFTKCLKLFFDYTYTQIIKYEETLQSPTNWGLRYWFVIIPLIIINYVTFLLAVFSDPGVIGPKRECNFNTSQLQAEFPNDGILFPPEIVCSTCKIKKPPRSKHCSSCDRCVLMFDHHCIWLNNDVGYYTFRWFFLFLCSICIIFVYGGYLSFYSLQVYLKSGNIPENINKASTPKKYWRLIKQTTVGNEITGILLLLCLLLFPLIGYFLVETTWSIYLGVTTNEIGKWNYIDELIKHDLVYQFDPEDGSAKVYLILTERLPGGQGKFMALSDRSSFNSNIGGSLEPVKGWDDLKNIYDRGFWLNAKQKLFPTSF